MAEQVAAEAAEQIAAEEVIDEQIISEQVIDRARAFLKEPDILAGLDAEEQAEALTALGADLLPRPANTQWQSAGSSFGAAVTRGGFFSRLLNRSVRSV
jgi:hypothetical protein